MTPDLGVLVFGMMSVSPISSLFIGFSLIVSDEPVLRDQFYDGNVKTERGELISVVSVKAG